MVKVTLLVSRTGGQNRGDEIEVSAEEAERMVDAEQCTLVRSEKVERAVKKAKSEKAVK
tara:strand:- start:2743 stop:2919 length:177 start_codon:yes stop_codon:yes gene_type:complete